MLYTETIAACGNNHNEHIMHCAANHSADNITYSNQCALNGKLYRFMSVKQLIRNMRSSGVLRSVEW
jgi:hypothetical protein